MGKMKSKSFEKNLLEKQTFGKNKLSEKMLGKRNNPFGDKNNSFEKRKQIPFFEKKKNLSEKKNFEKEYKTLFFEKENKP